MTLLSASRWTCRHEADRVDYIAVVDPSTLQPLNQIDGPARALVAAWIGKTRLIDNLEI